MQCVIFLFLSQFPSPNEYSSFMGDFSTATGIATFTMMLLSQFIFDKYGWGVAAKITPTVLLLTGVGFFSLILFGAPLAPALAKFGMTPLLAAVYVGALQNIFSKSAKYSLFDPCKEMAYIPLDEDTKVSLVSLMHGKPFEIFEILRIHLFLSIVFFRSKGKQPSTLSAIRWGNQEVPSFSSL